MATLKVSNGKDTFEVEEANLSKAQADGFVPTIKVSNGKETYDVHPNDLSSASKDGFKPLDQSFGAKTQDAISGLLGDMKKNLGATPEEIKSVAKTGLGVLPTVGMMAGSALGGLGGLASPIPGGAAMGGVVGSALGGVAGESLKQAGEKYFLDEGPATREQSLSGILDAAKSGAMFEAGGQAAGAALAPIGAKLGQYANSVRGKLKPNSQAIEAAADRLGFKPTQGMLGQNETLAKLEGSLSQSPRFTASPEREAFENVRKGFGRASENFEGLKTGESDFQLGSKLSSGLRSEVKAAKQPISELYNDINKDLLNIKLQPKINNQSVGILKKDSVFKTKDGLEFLKGIENDINQLKSVADLKEYRSNLLKNVTPSTSELDRMRYEKVYDQITNLRDASIQALKETDPFVKASGKSGREVIDELHNKLALADAGHASNMSQLEKIKGIAGVKGSIKSQGSFLRNLENIPEEKLIERAANMDVRTLNEFKDKYPALYENAKSSKVNDLISKSSDKGGVNVTRFIKNVENLEPEVKATLFDKNQLQMIDDLKLIQKETPNPIGPSGTPEGLDYKGLLSPKG